MRARLNSEYLYVSQNTLLFITTYFFSYVNRLDQRITTMEGSLTGVLTKMESIIKKMQTDEIG